jgi:LysM repeat protein
MRGTTVRLGSRLRVPATASVAARGSSASAGSGTRSHRVRRGQTLTHIARHYGVSLEKLRAANGMGKSSNLRAGQVLRIPRGS